MLNLKLKTIAGFVHTSDTVIDIGCDHAYLAIYLKENNLCKEVYASDISPKVLEIAKQNIAKHHLNILTYLSDGFLNIEQKEIDTAIISGMGSKTILNIIATAPKNIQKFIISSNHQYETLRKEMLKRGFYIKNEIVVYENKKYYPIMLFTKEKQKENKLTLKYGKSNNQDYFCYLLEKEKNILKKIPKRKLISRIKHSLNIKNLKTLIQLKKQI